jgi:hypothetical protein
MTAIIPQKSVSRQEVNEWKKGAKRAKGPKGPKGRGNYLAKNKLTDIAKDKSPLNGPFGPFGPLPLFLATQKLNFKDVS